MSTDGLTEREHEHELKLRQIDWSETETSFLLAGEFTCGTIVADVDSSLLQAGAAVSTGIG